MIYNLFAVHIKIIENERKNMVRKHRKKHVYDSKELIAKNRFVEEIQKRYSTLDPTQKIIVQTQTKLRTFRWYRKEKITPKMQKKKKNQSMDATKKNYFRNAEKYEWVDTEAKRSIA